MSFEPDPDALDFSDITQALQEVEALPSRALAPGDVIGGGRFIVQEHIGRGAVGEVWRVTDGLLERDLAVKIVRIQDRVSVAERDELTARVLREARAAREAGDRCLHIVRIFDVASLPSGDPFIVMEFLDGSTLRQWLSLCAPADWRIVRAIGRQCAAALRALHRKGFIHRDIKPDNVFALEDEDGGEVPFIRLIDFGLAKDLEAGKLTRTHASIGTQRYMAPELFFARGSTPETDIFSVGVILFEALAGKNPMPVAAEELAAAYRDGFESLAELCPEQPQWLTGLIDRCLALDPAERPDAEQLLAALEAGLDGIELPALEPLDLALDDGAVLPPLPALPPATPDEPAEHEAIEVPPAVPEAIEPPTPAVSTAIVPSAFNDEPAQRYSLTAPPPPRRSLAPVAFAVFAGFAALALAIVYVADPPETQTPRPKVSVVSDPPVEFKPRGPVDVDDFPEGTRNAPATTSAKSVASVPPAAAKSSSTTEAPVGKKSIAKAHAKRAPGRRARAPRKGLTKSFAQVRDAALARSGQPVAPPAAVRDPLEYDDEAGAQFVRIGKPTPSAKTPALPAGISLQASLVTGISSAAHDVVLARLTKDVVIDDKVVLKAGDILHGRSRHDFERIFIKFTRATHDATRLSFVGNAVTGGQPGIVATKRRVPKEERGTNVVARGALNTAGDVATRLGGGVTGALAGNVAREGVTEVRPDYREREPFVLTVPKGTHFTIIVLGK